MKANTKFKPIGRLICSILVLMPALASAENVQGAVKLKFSTADTVKTATATVFANDKPVKDVPVKFFVKRFYSLLPIGKTVTTDEQGNASVKFPNNLPGGSDGKLVIIAKLDDDPALGSLSAQDSVKWGTIVLSAGDSWDDRSLSASRSKAPMFLIITSNVIIVGIWLTLIYVVSQLFKLRNASRSPRK